MENLNLKQKYKVSGMSCSACVSHVEKAVNKIDGVKNVSVNLLTNSMVVEYDDKKIQSDDITKVVDEAGYSAEVWSENQTIKVDENKQDSDKISNDTERKSMIFRLKVSIICLIPLMYISMHHMFYEWFGLPVPGFIKSSFHGDENAIAYAFAQFLLLLPILYVNRKYFTNGFKSLVKGAPNMDTLIALGAGASVVYGIIAIFRIGYGLGHGDMELVSRYSMDIYFESAGTILTLITVGKYLEARSKGRTGEALAKLINLAPKTALVLRDGIEIQIKSKDIVIGDVVIVKAGETLPVDGIIIEGNGMLDQSAITGESILTEKQVGEEVIGATINKLGYFKMEVTKVGEDTTLSKIIALVEEASSGKAPIAKIADKISGVFVPIVMGVSVITFIAWLVTSHSIEQALSSAIAVLVISCPCALGLATPVAIMVGTGTGAGIGILYKNAQSLETTHLIDTVVMDKTGTLTVGKPVVTDVIAFEGSKQDLISIANALEKKSEHILSEAIVEYAKIQDCKELNADEFETIPGMGIRGVIDNKAYFAGNKKLVNKTNEKIDKYIDKFANEGKTPLIIGNSDNVLGIIAVRDKIKEESFEAVKMLVKMGIDVVMLTGDNEKTANAIGSELGIEKVISDVLPQDKERVVRELMESGKKVAMVGDGINDAPSLVRADVGIAIGAGTDIAIDAADIVLMRSNVLDVVNAIRLSKNVINNVKMNLFWAFFYNTVGIPLAALGMLNPMIGAAAMSLSSVCVVSNALRIKLFKETIIENKGIEKENIMEKTFVVEGMMCGHCKAAVEKALMAVEGVESAVVDLEAKTATVSLKEEVSNEALKAAIVEAGYEVVNMLN